jgi:hypothetical protein
MVGFVQKVGGAGSLKNHPVQCFYGVQKKHLQLEQSEVVTKDEGVKIGKIIATQTKPERVRANAHLEHEPSDETDLLISTINSNDLGFKADTCKYQRSHENFGAHCDSEPVQLA